MPIVTITHIKVGINRRPVKQQKVVELIESIKANGLLNPITVDQDLNLIAGLHRLTACKMLGLKEIECNVINCANSAHARLAEIDENLIRSELDALERAELWLERDRILDSLQLRAKAGDNQYTRKGSETISPPLKTTLELAQAVGYTERTFQQGKQIAKSILPEVKAAIKGTPVAKSTTALLKVARAGSKEREQAEQAELQQQADAAAKARAKQRELQLTTLQSVFAQKAQLQHVQRRTSARKTQKTAEPKSGQQWLLGRHFVYCGDTASDEFIHCLPSHAAIAIATPADIWKHDYLIDEARVVAVLRTEGQIHQFCTQQQMPFRFEFFIGGLYVALFSSQMLPEPQKPVDIDGVEAVVAFLIAAYSQEGNFVIAPFIGHGEVLISCERMGRICFAGDQDLQQVHGAIARWQQWTGKQVETST